MRGATGVLACAALAACGTAATPRRTDVGAKRAEQAHAEAFVVASIDPNSILLRDDRYLYWIDPAGIHRRPLGGREAGRSVLLTDETASWTDFTAIDVYAGTIVVTDGASVYALAPGAKKLTEIAKDVGAVVDVAVGEHDVAIATDVAILRVPIEGGPVQHLADGQTAVAGIDIDAGHIYWIDYGETRQTPPPPPDDVLAGSGAVRRVALAGGKVQTITAGQRGPAGIVVHDGRVWWTADRGPAIQSAKIDGTDVKTELAGAGDLLTVDDAGAVVRHPQGYVIEKRHGGSAVVRLLSDGVWSPLQVPPVVDADWVYAIAAKSYDGSAAILAVPRDDRAPAIALPIEGTVMRARARDGAIYWLEQKRDGTGVDAWRGDPARGTRRRLTDHYGWASDLAVGNGEVYISEDQNIYRVSARGGTMQTVATTESYITALTVHREHVFWIDGASLMARRRSGGEPFTVARAANGYGGGDSGGDIVFDDDYAYVTNFGSQSQGVFRISEGGLVETIWDGTTSYPGRDLVRIGDELFFWTQSPVTVYRLPLGGSGAAASLAHLHGSNGEGYVNDLVEGAGLIYISASYGDYYELTRIDPTTGDARAVLRWAMTGDPGAITADDSGAYVALDALGAILRVPHDAPALTDWSRGH
jgi:hypothetical protein